MPAVSASGACPTRRAHRAGAGAQLRHLQGRRRSRRRASLGQFLDQENVSYTSSAISAIDWKSPVLLSRETTTERTVRSYRAGAAAAPQRLPRGDRVHRRHARAAAPQTAFTCSIASRSSSGVI
jgi:hypothetical protein